MTTLNRSKRSNSKNSIKANEKSHEESFLAMAKKYIKPNGLYLLDKLNFIENYGTRIPRTLLAYNNLI